MLPASHCHITPCQLTRQRVLSHASGLRATALHSTFQYTSIQEQSALVRDDCREMPLATADTCRLAEAEKLRFNSEARVLFALKAQYI